MTTNDDQKPKDTTEADSSAGVSCAAPAGSGPPRCQTCKYWTRQPDKVYQPTLHQKPHGPAQITRYGICSNLTVGLHEPEEAGIANDPCHCSDYGETTTTGPLFGCVHHIQNVKVQELSGGQVTPAEA